MNKVYKLVWSKVQNMYVAVCEYAKSHTKSSVNGIINHAVVTGILACILSFDFSIVYAAQAPNSTILNNYYILSASHSGSTTGSDNNPMAVYDFTGVNKTDGTVIRGTSTLVSGDPYGTYTNMYYATYSNIGMSIPIGSNSGTTYAAGDGISISSDNKVYVS